MRTGCAAGCVPRSRSQRAERRSARVHGGPVRVPGKTSESLELGHRIGQGALDPGACSARPELAGRFHICETSTNEAAGVQGCIEELAMISRRRLIGLSAASALAPGCLRRAALAQEQGWPNRFVRMIVPYAPGGPTDIIARVVADRLAQIWAQQVVIENRGGGGGNIAAELDHPLRPRRLHDVHERRLACSQPQLLSFAQLRPDRGFRAGHAHLQLLNVHVRPELVAGKVGEGIHRLRREQQGQAHLCVTRRRHRAASLRRAVHPDRRDRDDARPLSRRRTGDE